MYTAVEERQSIVLFYFNGKRNAWVTVVDVCIERLYSGIVTEDCKSIVDISKPEKRCTRDATLVDPFPFKFCHKDIRQNRGEGGAHGYAVDLVIKFSVENKMRLLGCEFQELHKVISGYGGWC